MDSKSTNATEKKNKINLLFSLNLLVFKIMIHYPKPTENALHPVID